MSMFYSGRHRAPQQPSTFRTAGLGVATAAALGLAAPVVVTTGTASATPQVTETVGDTATTVTNTSFSGLVGYGDRGSLVRQVQRIVGTSADGIFGPSTRAAVMRWQSRNNLAADGVVGPRTGSAMGLDGSATTTRASRTDSRTSISGSTSSSSLLGTAASLIGTPYRWGGTTPSGFDCSGFTQYVFAKHGISLPRTAEQQRQAATRVSSPQPGDLVFFGAPAYHMGIYAGNGMMYDSGNSRVPVSKRAIWTSNVTYGRV